MNTYQSLVTTVENGTLNDLHENKLMRAILDSDPDDRMPPPPNAPLTVDQLNLLKQWLSQGAQNNACDENYGGCDPAEARYSTFILPLIQSRCTGCHSGNNPQGGITLSSYSEIKTVALNGKLVGSVNKTSHWVPKGGTKLDDCTLRRI